MGGITYELYIAEEDVGVPRLGVSIQRGERVYLGSVTRPRLLWVRSLDGEESFGGIDIARAVDRGHLRPWGPDEEWNGPLVIG
jgi:hypothetical protein